MLLALSVVYWNLTLSCKYPENYTCFSLKLLGGYLKCLYSLLGTRSNKFSC